MGTDYAYNFRSLVSGTIRRELVLAALLLLQSSWFAGGQGLPRKKTRRTTPPLPGSLNHTRARRILVAGLPLSGASLFAASLLQIHHSVGVTDVDPNGPLPGADDFKDVNKAFYVILRVTPNEKHALSDYVDSFKPDVKYAVVRSVWRWRPATSAYRVNLLEIYLALTRACRRTS